MEEGQRKTEELLEKRMATMKEDLSAELGEKIDKCNRKLDQMNKRMKGDDKEIVESINTVMKDDYKQSGKAIKRCREETEENVKKIRREIIVDDRREIEEIPENKNTEPTNPEPKENRGKKIQMIKDKEEAKMEERRTLRPRKARVTKELTEMTRNGLINVVNIPIINREEGIFRKEYRRRIMEIDEKENYITTKKKMTNRISQPRVSKRRVKYCKKKEGYQEKWDRIVEGYARRIREMRKERSQVTEVHNQRIDEGTQTKLRESPNDSTNNHQENDGSKYIEERKKTEEWKADSALIAFKWKNQMIDRYMSRTDGSMNTKEVRSTRREDNDDYG